MPSSNQTALHHGNGQRMHTEFKYHVPNLNRQRRTAIDRSASRRLKSNRYLHQHIGTCLSKAASRTHTYTQTSNVVNTKYRFECAPSCPIAQNRSTNHDACFVLDTHRLFSLALRCNFSLPVAVRFLSGIERVRRSWCAGR